MKTPLKVMGKGLQECFQKWYSHQQKHEGKEKIISKMVSSKTYHDG